MKLKTFSKENPPRIACDIDDTLVGFIQAFNTKFPKADWADNHKITKLVRSIRTDKNFWENLELLERPDFEITIYSTKRINSKTYTRNNLRKLGLPIRPIYQQILQAANKADMIKGKCDVLIDDSPFNVEQCLTAGFPAILIDRPHNKKATHLPRISKLCLDEIINVYNTFFGNGPEQD